MSFNLHLTVYAIEQLPRKKLKELNISSLNLRIQWIGDGKKHGFFGKRFKRSHTLKQQIQDNGIVQWNEEFEQVVNLKRDNSESFRSWNINLQVRGMDQRMKVNFKIGDCSSVAILQVKLQTTEIRSEKRSVFYLARTFTLRSFSLNQRHLNTENPRRNQRGSTSSGHALFATRFNNNQSFMDSSSDDEPEFDYKKLKMTNILLNDQFACDIEELKDGRERNHQKSPVNYKQETPLLSELGGDDIDVERRCLGYSKRTKVHPEEKAKEIGFEDEDQFEIGKWEKKSVLSRNGEMELSTDTFFASIDQRSEKADGGSACTVLAVIIADWMHRNPNSLPLRCQFDQQIREGSSEWRKLCDDDNYKENFSDQHFDLNTIIEARIRPIIEIVDNSFIGFFRLDDIEYLQAVRSFDSIWNELLHNNEFEERKETYFWSQKGESNGETNDVESRGLNEENGSPVEIICEGMECCKEYIKGFLAAIPLRGLQEDIRKGFKEENTMHKRLQIEFHYMAPCTDKSSAGL
uniref:C2 NT-type domain-containing protein n=1 Tax=Ananas comosus var. bracteatus TaxID=296719 RepID=A0A6V7NU36_ANACO|nr:unnamed protein product [Ananas comosus var. bracteatus]